jgi:hypothetical protein
MSVSLAAVQFEPLRMLADAIGEILALSSPLARAKFESLPPLASKNQESKN